MHKDCFEEMFNAPYTQPHCDTNWKKILHGFVFLCLELHKTCTLEMKICEFDLLHLWSNNNRIDIKVEKKHTVIT